MSQLTEDELNSDVGTALRAEERRAIERTRADIAQSSRIGRTRAALKRAQDREAVIEDKRPWWQRAWRFLTMKQ